MVTRNRWRRIAHWVGILAIGMMMWLGLMSLYLWRTTR